MSKFTKILTVGLMTVISFHLHAQNADSTKAKPSGQILDKIIAKVDNNIILESDLQKAYLEAVSQSQQGFDAPSRCDIFESLLINKLMVAKAAIDSIIVTDAEVILETDQRFNMVMQQFGGDEETLVEAYGKTSEQLKSEIHDMIKEQKIIGKMRANIVQDLQVSPADVRKFYNQIPNDSLPFFSAEVSVGQIVKKPEPGRIEKDKVIQQLKDIKKKIMDGDVDFASMAKKYSEDPGSKVQGGDLGFFRRGELAPEYEAMALSLRQGEIGEPVESQFGFHLIQLLEKKTDSFNTRHILIKPRPSENDIKSAERELDSLRNLIKLDSMSFAKAAKEFSDDRSTSDNGGFFSDPTTGANRLTLRTLEDPILYFTIDTMTVGTLSKPLRYEEQNQRTGEPEKAVRILFYKEKFPAHRANLEDDYEKLKAATKKQKETEALEKWFKIAKEEVFIDIDPTYDRCNALKEDD
ncbi:peptidylprolyl isomerase [Echinicola shivajiensis]|uniref:peptidylprolyl isomerase n=1 Tax=Echinicola shivajiensis TaxID=1035916 RepID=UPI001BFC97AF|nr:peptidylprolyl isomerase [Echinicola shivajiensis]